MFLLNCTQREIWHSDQEPQQILRFLLHAASWSSGTRGPRRNVDPRGSSSRDLKALLMALGGFVSTLSMFLRSSQSPKVKQRSKVVTRCCSGGRRWFQEGAAPRSSPRRWRSDTEPAGPAASTDTRKEARRNRSAEAVRATARRLRNIRAALEEPSTTDVKHGHLSGGAPAPWGARCSYALSVEPQVVTDVWAGTRTFAEDLPHGTLCNCHHRNGRYLLHQGGAIKEGANLTS